MSNTIPRFSADDISRHFDKKILFELPDIVNTRNVENRVILSALYLNKEIP